MESLAERFGDSCTAVAGVSATSSVDILWNGPIGGCSTIGCLVVANDVCGVGIGGISGSVEIRSSKSLADHFAMISRACRMV